jgi:NitT/TauT family transport system substrate-binding protein
MSSAKALSRRIFLSSSLAAMAVPAIAAEPPAILRVGSTTNPDSLAVIWGANNGIFQKRNLDVQVQKFNNGAAVAAAIVGGSLEIGNANIFSLMTAHLRGIPLVIESVAEEYTPDNPLVGILVEKSSPITNAAGLNGKTVATAALGDIFSEVTSVWVDQNGGDSKTIKFVELPSSAMTAAVDAGRIDAAIMADPLLAAAIQSGARRAVGHPYGVVGKRYGVTYFFSSRDYASSHVDVLARFRSGLDEATRYTMSHKREMLPTIVDFTGMDMALAEKVQLLLFSGISVDLVQPVIDFAARNKLIANAFPAADLIDPAALRSS